MAPKLPDYSILLQAGIDPKTGLPLKFDANRMKLKEDIRKVLRVNDEQICVNRYKWNNLPEEFEPQMIERILYYKGQGAFFRIDELDQFFFLPYALDGTIDVYGRFTGITPVPLASTGGDSKEQKPWIKGLVRTPLYRKFNAEKDDSKTACVLLNDYSKQLSQTVIPRQFLNESIIDVESDMIPYLRTMLRNSTGVSAMRVNSQDEYTSVETASKSINEAALMGHKYVPVIGQLDFQDLTGGQVAKAEEFLMSMQALDNFRLGTIGLDNGGLFQKKAHELQSESDMNAGGGTSIIMQDGLVLRQQFCDIVNSIPEWNLNISVEPDESQNEEAVIDEPENAVPQSNETEETAQ